MDAIKTGNLTKYYGKTRGVERVNLTVRQGDFFGFIGPNGAGKSTTIRVLLGLIRPDGGEARVFGLDAVREREKILARVGYVPAEVAFYPGMRVRDVLKLSARLRRRDCRKTAAGLCERLRLDMGRRVDELSFGNRKKTAIVCALQHEPDLLILDEPTGGLDPLMQSEFFAILRERKKEGATVFLSSHVLSEIQRNCTRAAMIRDGRIIADGSAGELFKTGIKRVGIRGTMDCGALTGVKDLRRTPDGVDFLYGGDMKNLFLAMAKGDVRDAAVTEPDLEEIFLHDYREGATGCDDRQA